MNIRHCPAVLAAILCVSGPGIATAAPVTASGIEMAGYDGGALPDGQAAITVKVQVLLDRAGISPGVIDGIRGGMSRSAISAFERRSGLPADGVMDEAVWAALQPFAGGAMTVDYTITEADAAHLTREIPTDYLEKANMTTLGYTSVAEKLGERFHMDEDFLVALNPGIALVPGNTIKVIAPSKPLRAKVAQIFVEKGTNRVAAYDDEGHMVVNYPATIGSSETPSPSGTHRVRAVAMNPEYTYNPSINFTQGNNTSVLTLPPGPNGPVGSVWIALTKPTYGLHGTPNPAGLFRGQSHGCVRLTNWDAEELAYMVQPGTTTVEFLEPGTSLADVMGEATGVSRAVQAAANAAARVAAPDAAAPENAGSLTLLSSRAPARKPVAISGQDAVAAGAVSEAPPDTQTAGSPAAIPGKGGETVSTPAAVPVDPLTAAVEAATSDIPEVEVTAPGGPQPAATQLPAGMGGFVLPQSDGAATETTPGAAGD
ncbi:L,D-transpeptidase family protein [Paracoccus aerodenitrificans]|uniref:L,D-transpeptidase family protein n=1 Tax=Paracoccus aerodenitrificans TaxID=3017781 RepID=UPI0022F11945|nr:L,D-transpeptidase [Paracoccus aerodenitrificans]WBU63284.1 L,D-transpeptidase [Paracoccus aerodenitrificans]